MRQYCRVRKLCKKLLEEQLSDENGSEDGQWCELSGAGKSLQARPAAEMDDMRTEAWLLAVELSDAIASPERRTPPWHIWN